MTRDAGFTLIELVVALAIAGLVVTTASLAVDAVVDAAGRSRELQEEARRDRNGRFVLATLLRSARVDSAAGEGLVALDAAEAPSGGDELAFTSVPGLAIAGHAAGEPLSVRVRRARGGVVAEVAAAHDALPPDTLLLVHGADAIEIRYLDPEYGEWLDDWEYTDRLPAGVAMGFGGVRPLPALVLHLPPRPTPEGSRRPAVGDRVGRP